jgi:hypothetical protein
MRLPTIFTTACLIAAAAVPSRAQIAAPNDSSTSPRDTIGTDAAAPVVKAVAANAVTESTPAAQIRGPSMTGLRAGVHRREAARPLVPNAAATNAHLGQARALMIVGGAAFIAGAIISGDVGTIIMVGGAVVGLYGLYQYLQ